MHTIMHNIFLLPPPFMFSVVYFRLMCSMMHGSNWNSLDVFFVVVFFCGGGGAEFIGLFLTCFPLFLICKKK